MGVDAYFDKPLDPTRLIATIGSLLAARGSAGSGISGAATSGSVDADEGAREEV